MEKRIRKSDDFYRESLSWMAYRYAIGITEYVGRSGKFLEDHATTGLPEDVSPEMKEELSEYEMGTGYFMLSELSHFYDEKEQEMLSHMLQSRDYQMVKQLNRIERYVKKKPLAKRESEAYCPYSSISRHSPEF